MSESNSASPKLDFSSLSLEEVSPVGIFHADASGECVYINQRLCEMAGISAQDALGRGWLKAVHPADRERVAEAWFRMSASGEPIRIEYRLQWPTGEQRWVMAQASRVVERGEVQGFLGAITDVTELKRTEEALRSQKELSEGIIACSVDGILAFDRECRYTVWNPGMELISGFPKEKVVGQIAFDVFPFLVEIGEDRFFHIALSGESAVARDRPFRIPSTGREGFFDGHYAPLRNGKGEVIGGLAIIKDITEHKAALDALTFAQGQVVQAGKLAAMGELGAGIAHELNQPLAGIRMLVSLIQRKPDLPIRSFSSELALVVEQVDRMASIVDNVRGFARKSKFEAHVTDPLQALTDALMLMSEQLRLAGIDVVQELESELPPILADSVQLQQVFLNLLSNALHALEEADPTRPRRLELHVKSVEERVEYRVVDTGPGISAEVADRVFDPFFTTKETGRGTGLGLSLAYGIVRAHRGTIRHEEPEGGGACFVVRIPVAQGDRAPAPVEDASEESARKTRLGRVLVVDDELVLRRALGSCLEELGHPFTLTSSAAEAEEELGKAEHDLALIDLKMPGTSGDELCAKLRESHPDLVLVAMSGFVTEEMRQKLTHMGVRDVLTKPFGVERLQKVFAEELGQ